MSVQDGGSGFVLERIVFTKQHYEIVAGDQLDDETDAGLSWGWDWQWTSHDRFEVAITLHLEPTPARPEEVEVALLGTFKVDGDSQTLPLVAFTHDNAPAILFPYARQAIDELTARGPFGRLLLPPMNVLQIMSEFPPESAQGAKQPPPAAARRDDSAAPS